MHVTAFGRTVILATTLTFIGILSLSSTYYSTTPIPQAQTAFLYVMGTASLCGGLLFWFFAFAVASSFLSVYLPIRRLYRASNAASAASGPVVRS